MSLMALKKFMYTNGLKLGDMNDIVDMFVLTRRTGRNVHSMSTKFSSHKTVAKRVTHR